MSGYPPPLDSGRNPFELFVLGLSLAAAGPLLAGSPAPGSTAALLGPGLARVWAGILAVGCLVALIGVWWTWWGWFGRFWSRWSPSPVTGLLIEQVGLVAVAVGMGIYATGVAQAAGPGRAVPVGLAAALSLAALWRAGQIQRWVRAAVQEQQG